MEHTFKIEKELKITTENIVDCVLSCEAGGFDYWGELCSDEKDYEAARQRLAEREAVCDFRRSDLRLIKTGWPGSWPVIFLPVRLAGLKNRL